MLRPALNFYVKFTPGNFKGPASARRACAIFETASPALQNFISAFKFYPLNLTLLLKFTLQKSASIFKFSRHRFALNLRAVLHAIFAAAEALSAKILSRKILAPRNFTLLNSASLNLMPRNSARQNFTPQNFDPQSSVRQSLGQQGYAQQSFLARQSLALQKIARRNRATKMVALQNFMRLNLAVPRSLLLLNLAFKFKASADV